MSDPRPTSPGRPRPASGRPAAAPDPLADELARLPVRRGDETWEAALIMLPSRVREGDDPPYRPVVALCASSEGAVAAGEPMSPAALDPTCLLHAIARFALEPLVRGAPPLGYLPPRVLMPSRRDAATDRVEQVLVPLGVSVQRTDDLPHFLAAARDLGEYLEDIDDRPLPLPGLLTAKGMTVDRVRGCAEAMALFCAAAPWRTLADEVQWRITPAPTTRALRTCIVTGSMEEQIGLGFLSSMEDFVAMHAVPEITGVPYVPSTTLWSVMLEPLANAPEADIELWPREGLPFCEHPAAPEVSGPRGKRAPSGARTPGGVPAIPLPLGVTPAGRPMRPTPAQLLLMETLLRGFAAAATSDLQRESLRFEVRTSDGPRGLTLRR